MPKIAIFNNSGNVGKSTIAREVLGANMQDCHLVEVETHNHGNTKFEHLFTSYTVLNATNFDLIYQKLVENDNVVLDIGASNVLDFMRQLNTYEGVESMINHFIIPSTKDAKQLQDTLKTVQALQALRIDPNDIFIVCNRAEPTTFENDFSIILNAQKKIGFNAGAELMIRETSTLKDLELLGKSITETMQDQTDYRAKIAETKGTAEQKKWVKLDLAKMASKKIHQDFLKVFQAITARTKA